MTELEAGKPYIIKWEGDGTDNIVNPMFTGVTITLTSKSERTVERADGHVKFIGYYDAFTIDTPADDDIYYLTTGDELRHTAKKRTLKACRAYFQFSKAVAARQLVLDFGENIGLSGIIAIDNGQETDGDAVWRGAYRSGWYTLDGRRLSGRPTQHGVYVKDGKKAVMK